MVKMKSGIVLSGDEIKQIVAKHFNVPEDNVIKTKYSYIVIDAKCGDIVNSDLNSDND